MITLKNNRPSRPQYDFWHSPAPYRLLLGGVGSGKTHAGCIEVLRQGPNTTGFVLGPTYPMVRDATLRSFLEIVERAGIPVEVWKNDGRVVLPGNRTVIFKNASDPDKLRGPNLNWVWLDEAAMMERVVFDIMIARLRLDPGRLWITTTPLGKNWLYELFGEGQDANYATFKAPTWTNKYNRPGFVDTLRKSYDSDFARQEIEGEWIDHAYGVLIPPDWLERASTIPRAKGDAGQRYMGVDPSGGTGRDRSAICVIDRYGILHLEASRTCDIPNTALRIKQLSSHFNVSQSNIAYDASTGGGGDELPRHLQQYGITATRYLGGQSGGERFANLRSMMGHRLKMLLDPALPMPAAPVYRDPYSLRPTPEIRNTLQPPFVLSAGELMVPLKREIAALRFLDRQGRFSLESKDAMKARLGNGLSPDLLDALFIALSKLPSDFPIPM